MPEQTILNLQIELENIAEIIQTQVNLTAIKHTAIQQKMESLENLKGGLLNTVLNARFEINQKLMFTNDDQRRVALNELKIADADYQARLAEFYTLEEQKKQAEAEAEFQRKLFRAKELTMLFYANQNA